MKKTLPIIAVLLVILAIAGLGYWYFFMEAPGQGGTTGTPSGGSASTGFAPFGRTPSGTAQNGATGTTSQELPAPGTPVSQLPTLRLLSNTPVGGYGASTTASTTVVRWIDRGRGNVYEAHEDSAAITTLSNTILPRMYASIWNKNLTAFIGSILDTDGLRTVYAGLSARATSTDATTTPFALSGQDLPENMIAYAASPKRDKIFMMTDEDGMGVGYVANFDGSSVKKIFTSPLTQVNADWPEDNTIAITTKGSADQGGYLYLVDPRTGVWKKVIGPVPGMSAVVSHDAKYAVISTAGAGGTVLTSIFSLAKGTGTDAVIRTLADKCAWGNFYKDMVYCGVPSQPVSASYPDDWYKGSIQTIDKIWQVNAQTGEVHLVSSIVDQSDRVIDAFHLGLDAKDDYLFFMNKNDLSLWSLDLVTSQVK